jgi:hypothetical protein
VNVIQIGALCLFSDLNAKEVGHLDVIGGDQMKIMNYVISLGSVLMLPILSEPIAWMSSQGCLKKTDFSVKCFLVMANLGLGIFICAYTG